MVEGTAFAETLSETQPGRIAPIKARKLQGSIGFERLTAISMANAYPPQVR